MGATIGKFDSSVSNEKFWQLLTSIKINKKKQQFEDLKNLIYFLELQKGILNVYKSQIKTNIKHYF